jgi:DNA-binding transcriptional LysR family regulator
MRLEQLERRLKLRELRILLAVVRAGGMAKGAAELGISQPNVSKAIADLEHAFGVRILDRTAYGVEPTMYGRALVERAKAMFDELRYAVKDVAFLADPTSGQLRIGCSDFAAGAISVAMDRMSSRYPRISFEVLSADGGALQRELRERTIELFVAIVEDSLDTELFDAEVLYDDPLVVVADGRHPLVRRRRVELAELVNKPWAMPPANTASGSYIREVFQRADLPLPDTVVSTYSTILRHNMIATGRFITVLPKSMLEVMAAPLSLKALPVELPPRRRAMALVVLRQRTLSPIAQLFVQTMRDVAKPKAKMRRTAASP